MRALIISADIFEDSELKIPYQSLQEIGIHVDIASIKKGTIVGKHGFSADVTMSLDEVNPKKYDILILPGGKAPSVIRKEQKALEIARYFFDHNKLVAAICHGPQILISAGLLRGRVVTGYKSIADELKDAGAIYKDEEVVIDNNLITSRQPSDLNAFMEAIKQYLYKNSYKKNTL
ncbi:type 1 glutamine amidotransferase domain-containing protein [Sulfurovum sp.]|uniref:type 1 glutamine amidotransferase domain-containing protein n=1 Tax=Sulfurovum sp. TaxID=1969726 RepID=UPI00286826C9|nr:type 1 glutamine amidotransferase domain-containing protein [Sulfurovum sp.]